MLISGYAILSEEGEGFRVSNEAPLKYVALVLFVEDSELIVD